MGMFGLKLRTNIPCADVIKILRQFDPDASISNLRFKIIHNDFVYVCDCIRFLYKGIIIKHNKTEPTYTKTSLFLCEKRRFFMGRTEKGGKVF